MATREEVLEIWPEIEWIGDEELREQVVHSAAVTRFEVVLQDRLRHHNRLPWQHAQRLLVPVATGGQEDEAGDVEVLGPAFEHVAPSEFEAFACKLTHVCYIR